METRLECLTRQYLKCPSGIFPDDVWELVKLQHDEIERLQGIVNQAGVIERKKNRDVLQALGQMSGNPDEHYIPPVTLAKRARKAEDTVQNLRAEIERLKVERDEAYAAYRLEHSGRTGDLKAHKAEIERLQGIIAKLSNRCRHCCSYSPGCGSEYDGICKHRGLPPVTELGRHAQRWRHVYEYDSCKAFDEERTQREAAEAKVK